MRAITLHQPYASLIALGDKTIETRSWPAPKSIIGHRIAIHASSRLSGRRGQITELGDFELTRDLSGYLLRGPIAWPYRLPLGAVVCTAVVSDSVPMVSATEGRPVSAIRINHIHPLTFIQGNYDPRVTDLSAQLPYGEFAPGRWAWMLEDVLPLARPIPAKGKQGLWNFDLEPVAA